MLTGQGRDEVKGRHMFCHQSHAFVSTFYVAILGEEEEEVENAQKKRTEERRF